MAIGTKEFFSDQKGVRFLKQENFGQEVFVHTSAVQGGDLKNQQRKSYEVGQDRSTCKDKAENANVI